MRRIVLVLALFIALAAFVASGCGSDDSTTSSTAAGDTSSAAESGETTPGTDESADSGKATHSDKATGSGKATDSGDKTSEADGAAESGGEPTESSGSLTKAEYVKQGNEACAQIQEEMGKEFAAFVKEDNLRKRTPSEAESQEIIARFAIPAMREQIDALRALPAPSGDEEKVGLIIARQEASLKKIEKEPLFRTSGAPYEELNKPASDYGLTACSV